MDDYSFEVPLFGGSLNRSIRVNALDVVHCDQCMVCGGRLQGAVVCIGKPYSCMLHKHCMHNLSFARGWPHRYPASYYVDMCFASEAASNVQQQIESNKN
jgi:hypothetical protein